MSIILFLNKNNNENNNNRMNTNYDYINKNIINKLKLLDYNINSYKINYLEKNTNIYYPDYFIKNNFFPKLKTIKKLSASNMIKIYEVNRALSDILFSFKKEIYEGVDVAYLDNLFFKKTCDANLFPSVLGYGNYPKASCISINNTVCHGVPYKYKLKKGDILTLDVCAYNKYHSDMAETYMIGSVSGEHKKMVNTTKDCIDKAISICKPGANYSDIGSIVEKIAKDNGFCVIEKYGGHGIGTELHMNPFISNIKSNIKSNIFMKEGDIFTIEPLITIGSGTTFIDKDGFSICTSNNKYSAHYERVILITHSGYEVLNDFI